MTPEFLHAESNTAPHGRHLGPKPFSPESLAERWGCSAEKVRQMVHRGELRGFRLGKLIRIKAIEVERYECSQLQETNNTSLSLTAENSPSQLGEEKAVAEFRLARMIQA